MSDETQRAFAHPEERAAHSRGRLPNRISLREHVIEADIGAFQKERGHPQRLRFDVVVELRPWGAPLGDDVDRILSYDRITEAIAAELAAERVNLLETLAERIAARILAEPQADRVFVRIEKLDRGPGALGVEIVRRRGDVVAERTAEADDAPHPMVVYLDNEAIRAPDLPSRLDRLASGGVPVVLAVGVPDEPRPITGHAPTQRRIDLLAIEQNAWFLAARDPRCVVVSTRTEMDWAMRHGQLVVWAPSKIVLDALDRPKGPCDDGAALAVWFAERLSAVRLVVHGSVALPAGSRVPIERA